MLALSRTCRALVLADRIDLTSSCHLRYICNAIAQKTPAHPLQGLTDTYLPPPQDSLTGTSEQFWSPSDPAPLDPAHQQASRAHTEPLTRWIRDNGGYVNPKLALGASPSLGCRGVLATEDMDELKANEALIMLPTELTLSVRAAKAILQENLSARSISELERKNLNMVMALALCCERRKGLKSFWKPYIATLPARPPCAWLLKGQQQSAALRSAGLAGQLWRSRLKAAAKAKAEEIARVVKSYGPALGLGVADLQWGLGMVASRTYSSTVDQPAGGKRSEPCLLPYIDMCNHHDEGLHPGWGRDVDQQWVACIVNPPKGLSLKKGDELFTTYFGIAAPGFDFFLNYGVVR